MVASSCTTAAVQKGDQMFKYELGQAATTTTGEACAILGRAEHTNEPNM